MNDLIQKCNKCKKKKNINEFEKGRKVCFECRKKQQKRARIKRRGPLKKRKKLSKKELKRRQKERSRKQYLKNREKKIAYSKEWNKKNPDKHKKNLENFQNKPSSKAKRKKYDKEYRKKNRDKRRIWAINYEARRKSEDVCFKIRRNISNAIYCALVINKSTKNNKSILKYLPYTIQELKKYLESQFESWMNWDNWGVYDSENWDDNNSLTWTWQIDHIIPKMKFKYNSMEDEEFQKCWALSNLRPYSAKQNVLDGFRK